MRFNAHSRCYRPLPAAALALLAAAWVVGPARAQRDDGVGDALQGVGVDQKLDAQLPLDLWFKDEDGRDVRLGSYFRPGKPVILLLNYYRCPMLCGLLLNGMLDALKPLDWTIGEQFDVITVSFDPLEEPPLAAAKKQNYVADYGRYKAASGWHFLTGRKENIRALTSAVGFRYYWNADKEEWAHPSTLILCTPEGRISRYLGGIQFEPDVVRLSLVEASGGKIGSLYDLVFLSCFHYSSSEGQYTPNVRRVMMFGGVLTMLTLALTLAAFWRADLRRTRRAAVSGGESRE